MYLKFMCRPSKMLQNGLCPLELSIIIEGKRKIIRFQKFIKASDFNASRQHVKRNPEVNEYMESIRAKFYSIETEMLQRNIPITTQNVLDIYKNGFAETKLTVLMLSAKTRNNAPKILLFEKNVVNLQRFWGEIQNHRKRHLQANPN